jgi:hypothetical protein
MRLQILLRSTTTSIYNIVFISKVSKRYLCVLYDFRKITGKTSFFTTSTRDELVTPGSARRCYPFRFGISFTLCAFACDVILL